MKIYRKKAHNKYDWLFIQGDDPDLGAYDYLEGQRVSDTWGNVVVEPDESKTKYGEFPLISTAFPGISEKAMEIYKPYIGEDVEFLPVISDTKKRYFVMNVLSVIDALDVENSDVDYFDDECTRIMDVDRYAFKEKEIGNHLIFKLKQFPRSYIFVTEEFVEIAKANKLKGFSARLVWDSENPNSEDIGKSVSIG